MLVNIPRAGVRLCPGAGPHLEGAVAVVDERGIGLSGPGPIDCQVPFGGRGAESVDPGHDAPAVWYDWPIPREANGTCGD